MLNYRIKKILNKQNKIAIDKKLLADILHTLDSEHGLYATDITPTYGADCNTPITSKQISKGKLIKPEIKDFWQIDNQKLTDQINRLFKENK